MYKPSVGPRTWTKTLNHGPWWGFVRPSSLFGIDHAQKLIELLKDFEFVSEPSVPNDLFQEMFHHVFDQWKLWNTFLNLEFWHDLLQDNNFQLFYLSLESTYRVQISLHLSESLCWIMHWFRRRDAVSPFELYSSPVLLKLGILGLISFTRSIQSRPDESVQKLNKALLIRSART